MKYAKEFLEKNKDQTTQRPANFTTEQEKLIQRWAKQMDLSFEDMAMFLIHVALVGMQEDFLQQLAKRSTVVN